MWPRSSLACRPFGVAGSQLCPRTWRRSSDSRSRSCTSRRFPRTSPVQVTRCSTRTRCSSRSRSRSSSRRITTGAIWLGRCLRGSFNPLIRHSLRMLIHLVLTVGALFFMRKYSYAPKESNSSSNNRHSAGLLIWKTCINFAYPP